MAATVTIADINTHTTACTVVQVGEDPNDDVEIAEPITHNYKIEKYTLPDGRSLEGWGAQRIADLFDKIVGHEGNVEGYTLEHFAVQGPIPLARPSISLVFKSDRTLQVVTKAAYNAAMHPSPEPTFQEGLEAMTKLRRASQSEVRRTEVRTEDGRSVDHKTVPDEFFAET